MFYIGCHLSASEGFLAMGRTALSIGANTFQFFTRNPRGSRAKAIDPKDAEAFLALAKENGFGTLVAHAPYTINPCSKDEHTREFARMTHFLSLLCAVLLWEFPLHFTVCKMRFFKTLSTACGFCAAS